MGPPNFGSNGPALAAPCHGDPRHGNSTIFTQSFVTDKTIKWSFDEVLNFVHLLT